MIHFSQLSGSILSGADQPLMLIVLGLAPFFGLGWWLHRQKARYKAQATEPFTRALVRPPGESLRARIDELAERFDNSVATLGIINVLGVVVTATADPANQRLIGATLGIIVAIAYAFYAPRLSVLARELWDCRLGYKGERAVGEELNQLLAAGFRVFHDVPFDGFNIDHVIVGPPGVYAVETKTRRKLTNIPGREKATVEFDGNQLHFPSWSVSKPLEQARLNAKTLSEWLTSAVGERIPVNAILTIPGWWVERKARGDVNVLNPEEIKHSFPPRPKEPLSEKQIQQIVHQLTERCRMKTD